MTAIAGHNDSACAVQTSRLHQFMRKSGRGKVATIGHAAVFLPIHDSVLYAAPANRPGEPDLSFMRPLKTDADLDAFGLLDHLPSFLQAPILSCAPALALGNRFAEQLVKQIADSAGGEKQAVLLRIGKNFLRIEALLSDDGPGSCMMAEGWIVWADGLDGLASLLFAPNPGSRPNPELSRARRWRETPTLSDEDLARLDDALTTMTQRFEIRNFLDRIPPQMRSGRMHRRGAGIESA